MEGWRRIKVGRGRRTRRHRAMCNPVHLLYLEPPAYSLTTLTPRFPPSERPAGQGDIAGGDRKTEFPDGNATGL